MMKRKEFMLGAVAGLAFAAAATAGGVIDWPTAEAGPVAGVSGRLAPSAGAAGLAFAPPQGAPLSFADIFAQVAPAVVQIEVETRVRRSAMIQIPGTPFAIPNPNGGGQPGAGGEEGEEGPTATGAGSGFFISADGFIVTNNHVVADASEITVTLADGRELKATVVGTDQATDLAVIKVQGSDFPFVSFEEAGQPRVGDWVIAVGNPFGLGGTATAGIVSAVGRPAGQFDQSDAGYVDFLQIDAAINRGNSGGPTFDIYGRVIGVNSAIISPTGTSAGIGFAIPAAVAKSVTDQLIGGGKVERGYVGLTLTTPTRETYESYGLDPDVGGALVNAVTPGGPADRAGLQVEDVITSINGERVENSTEATRIVAAVRPGSAIRMEIDRNGRRVNAEVRSGTRPSEDELRASVAGSNNPAAPGKAPAPEGVVVEGIGVAPLTARQREALGEGVNGVVITSVEPGGPAAELGLRAGMVITRANRGAVTTPAEFRAAIQAARAARRSGVALFVLVPGAANAATVVLELGSGD